MSAVKSEKKVIAVEEGLFKLPIAKDAGYLIGNKCNNCGSVWWPTRFACSKCCSRDMTEIALSKKGKLYSYVILRQAPRNTVMVAPYAVGLVELPDGCRFFAAMTDCDVESVHIGQEVEIVFKKIKEDEEGNDVISFMFRPV